MVTYIPANSKLIKISSNGDNQMFFVDTLHNFDRQTDWMWVVDRDGVVQFEDELIEVKSGQLVVMLYSSKDYTGKDRKIIVVDSPEWVAHSKGYSEWQDNRYKGCDETLCSCDSAKPQSIA